MQMDWLISKDVVPYEDALREMESRVAGIRAGTAEEAVWLLEHPPLYTAGTSAKADDLLDPRFPVFETGRGGEYTYHGPGQRVAYVMMDLRKRQSQPDIKKYVWQLEEWVILTLAQFGVTGERREGRVGIWVTMADGTDNKIAALGVRVRHWITFHGVAINVSTDLSHYSGIVPCGIAEHGVVNLNDLFDEDISLSDVDQALKQTFAQVFDS